MERTSRNESELLSLVAHELRGPITVVAGLVETLSKRRGELTEEEFDDFLERLRRQATRLYFLVGALLDDAQVATGRFNVALQAVDVGHAAERALANAPAPPGQTVVVGVPSNLTVVADPRRLDQVLVNLINNAYRYGGPRIRLEARETTEGVLVTVSDDGVGVPDELVPRIFERFTRGLTPTSGQGSGLGLAIARDLVEAFGGRIWYEPGKPGGASFNFILSPIRAGEDYGLDRGRLAKGGSRMARILVVDDEPDMRFLLRMLFEGEGHEVLEAHHGVAALEILQASTPDVVITDVMMPVMDGNELIRRLRSDPATAPIPILAVSASPRPPADADASLSKPFFPDDVIGAVDALVTRESHGPA